MRTGIIKKTICTVVTTVFTMTQLLIYAPAASADPITDYATQGKAFGDQSATWFKNNLPELNNKKITIKRQNGETLSIDSMDNMTGSNNNSKHYSIETSPETLEKLRDIAGDTKKRADLAKEQQDSLMGMVQKITNGDPDARVTIENTVYSLLKDQAAKKLPDYSADAMFQVTRAVLEDLANNSSDLAACDSSSEKVTKDEIVHIPNEVVCQQVLDRSGECDLTHEYEVPDVVQHESGPMNIGQCKDKDGKVTPACVRIWAGIRGFHIVGSGTTAYSMRFSVNQPDAVVKAKLVYMSSEDEGQAFFGVPGDLRQYYYRYSFKDCSQWDPYNIFPRQNCGHESSLSRDPNPGSYFQNLTGTTDFTPYLKKFPAGTVFEFRIQTYVPKGHGNGYGAMQIEFDPNKIKANHDTWGPSACLDNLVAINDGMAKGTFTCVDMPATDGQGCALQGLTPVCEQNLEESPIKEISPLCKKVKVSGNFTFYKGDTGCWQAYLGADENGNPLYEEVCGGENAGGNLDTCKEYEEAGCTFLGSDCTPGMMGASGNCYVADLRYDCGTDEVVSKTKLETNYACTGIRCLGSECAEIRETKSSDFAKVNAMLNMIDQAGQDMQCTGVDDDGAITGQADVVCQVFKGQKGSCKIAVGGWQNCCKQNGSTPSLHTYIKTMRSIQSAKGASEASQKLLSGAQSISSAKDGVGGVIGGVVDGAVDFAFDALMNYAGQFASFIDEKTGKTIQVLTSTPRFVYDAAFTGIETVGNWFNVDLTWIRELFSPARVFMDQIKAKIKEYITKLLTKFVSNITGEATGAGVSAAAGQQAGANAAASAVGTALMVVGYVYMAYMIAKMIVSIVYACEEEEMETVSKIAVKGCHYLGSYCVDKVLGVCIMKKRSYCCFSSPLGRILNEQVKAQTETVTLSDGTTKQVPKVAGWGSAKEPNCEGIYVEDMDKIDWDAIDLSEWTHILETNNLSMEQEKALAMEPMTGKGESIK